MRHDNRSHRDLLDLAWLFILGAIILLLSGMVTGCGKNDDNAPEIVVENAPATTPTPHPASPVMPNITSPASATHKCYCRHEHESNGLEGHDDND